MPELFLSYARADNNSGLITTFLERLQHDYLATTGNELSVFFDVHDIHGMDDWLHKILSNLRRSHILLACLSPSYLESEYCRKEFEEFLSGEVSRGVSGSGIAPVYVLEIPGWKSREYESRAPEWVQRLRRRQVFDVSDVEALIARLADRIRRADGSAASPGNVAPHNEFFSGREVEMERLRARLVSPSSTGGFTILHGLGGMGKTSLAVEYAHNYAHEYPGGRWQAKCGAAADLGEALAGLAGRLGIEFSGQESADSKYRAGRVLAELERKAKAKDGDCLLILDGVDTPALLTLDQTRILPREKWLHIVITSQRGPDEFPDLYAGAWLPVDELSEADSLRLLERAQPEGIFRDPEERERALRVVKMLGGFTLAVEAAAVFLVQFPRAGCAALLEEMEAKGLAGLEQSAARTSRSLAHGEKLLTATLRPMLDLLAGDEWLAVELASLMPADSVVWEWVESLVGDRFPAVEEAEDPGEMGRWTAIRDRLQGLRLVTGSSEAWAGRMHGLVQEAVWLRHGFDRRGLRKWLVDLAFQRCAALERDWENRPGDWEVEALRRWALHLMEEDELGGGALEERVAGLLHKLGRYREEEPLRRHVLRVRERVLESEAEETVHAAYDLARNLRKIGQFAESAEVFERCLGICESRLGESDQRTLACMSGLGEVLHAMGDSGGAEMFCRRAIEGEERVLGPEHPRTLSSVNILAGVLARRGDYAGAEPLCRRALQCRERELGPEHPDTLISVNALARLLESNGDYVAAEPLCRRALDASERVLGPDHPDTLTSVNNLAYLLESKGDKAAAEPFYRRALEARERVLGPDHPDTLTSVNNLAYLLGSKGDKAAAEPFYRRALEARERVLGPDHPDTLTSVNNLAGLLQSQGDHAAEPLYRCALEAALRVLGPDHPSTKIFAVNHQGCLKTIRNPPTGLIE